MIGKLAGERIREWLKPEIALQFQQVLAPGCITCAGVIMEELRADVQLPRHISQELRGWLLSRFQRPSRKAEMAKLNGKAEPVMIPPVSANDLEIFIRQCIVAGNLPLPHRKMRFEKFRPLCSGEQFVRWNGAAPDSGGGVRSYSFTRSFFKVPIERRSRHTEGIADVGNAGVSVLHKRPRHADLSRIHFCRAAAISSSCPRGSEPGLSSLTDKFPLKFRQGAEYVEDQFASAGGGVHALAQALKADFAGGESIYGLDEMLQGTAEPVQLPHDQRVSVAGVINGFGQTFAGINGAAGNVAEDFFAPGLLESILLQIRILVGGGNPCIADAHAQPPCLKTQPGSEVFETQVEGGISVRVHVSRMGLEHMAKSFSLSYGI